MSLLLLALSLPRASSPAGPGQAIANFNSVAEGAKIVEQALQKWGRVDILINNAGILRDKSFKGMSDAEFDLIQEVGSRSAELPRDGKILGREAMGCEIIADADEGALLFCTRYGYV